ncbi:uncharacterized protein LOC132544873 [Ylistrum balloti]|uniref:uncharacterized protein LOC132544873 n=1 Tax=Ylistrum balloti TaxID=509963 RepID=UPI002905AD9F|nr:uncharacterized protein LOC132544873 [Ylistrum balloti]
MDMRVTIFVTVVSGLLSSVICQTTPPMTYVTGSNVCVVNVTFLQTRLVTFRQRMVYYVKCSWNKRCARYRTQLKSKTVISDSWRFEPRCCEGFIQSEDRCQKTVADKIKKGDTGTDVIDHSIWPPIIGSVLAVVAISVAVIIIVFLHKAASKKKGEFGGGIHTGKRHAINNQTYADALPSVSHSYDTVDSRRHHSYEMLDSSRVGMTQNIYDSINTYKILQSGSIK